MGPDRAVLLGVNIDHVATLRQARGTRYPDPLQAAGIAARSGADGITVHLREDRRHIQHEDVVRLKANIKLPLNLEMAATPEMVEIAARIRPAECCLVPERRAELTTEGGLDVANQVEAITLICTRLQQLGIAVSLFIDPDPVQVAASARTGAKMIELHTGRYADAPGEKERAGELSRLAAAGEQARGLGLVVNAGHGLNYDNVAAIAALPGIHCLNIGHAIIAEAVMSGLAEAVRRMKNAISGSAASPA